MQSLTQHSIKLSMLLATSLFTSSILASPAYYSSSVGNPLHLTGIANGVNNPAGPAAVLFQEDDTFQMGILSSIGGRIEYGPVDSMIDELDRLSTQLDRTNLTPADAEALITDFGSVLQIMGRDGYFNFSFDANLPLTPIIFRNDYIGGVVAVEVGVNAEAQMRVLDSPLQFNPISKTMDTSTSLYIKGATQSTVGIGYSRELMEFGPGMVYVGGKAKLISMGLNKIITPVSGTNDVGQTVADEFDQGMETSTGIALDAGVYFVAENFRVGATMYNINQPEFSYKQLGQDCVSLTGGAQNSCYIAIANAHRIALEETHIMNAHSKIDAALYTSGGNFIIAGSYDVSPIVDPVGNEHQYMMASVAFVSNYLGTSLSYRKNMAGTQLSDMTLGFNIFRHSYLNLTVGQETITVDGSDIPRLMALSFGIGFTF